MEAGTLTRRGVGHHGRRGVYLAGLGLLVAVMVTLPAEAALHEPGLTLTTLLIIGLIVLGALGDLLAIAAAAATEPALHSMGARRLPGVREALVLKRHADRVASIAGDIVGDVAGTVSGAAAGAWAVSSAARHGWPVTVAAGLAVAVVAALTIGAKGTLKGVALLHANAILRAAGCVAAVLRVPWHRTRADAARHVGGARSQRGGARR